MLKIVYKNKYITYKLNCEIALFQIKLHHRIFEVIYLTQIYLFFLSSTSWLTSYFPSKLFLANGG